MPHSFPRFSFVITLKIIIRFQGATGVSTATSLQGGRGFDSGLFRDISAWSLYVLPARYLFQTICGRTGVNLRIIR